MSEILLTIRLIKSFEFRTTKNVVIKVSDTMSIADLKQLILQHIQNTPGFKPYLKVPLDTLKLYFTAHGTKSQNLIINLDDTPFLEDNKTLKDSGLENETEVSFFVADEYKKYKSNPELKW